MKRKKIARPMSDLWILAVLWVTCSFICAGCESRPRGDGERASPPVGPSGPSGQPGQSGPRLEVRDEETGDEDRLHLRRLLATNGTSDDKSIWEEIEEFYSDSNNMAMYCVLPLIVLVYGGCSAIYCIYKCRRYFRRRKHKRLRNEDDQSVGGDERNDLNQEGEGAAPIKTVSGAWDDDNAAFTQYNVQRRKTPLPWDTPQKIQRQDSFEERSRDGDSDRSRESTSLALEREREKLEQKPTEERINNRRQDVTKPTPVHKAHDPNRLAGSRPIEIVPISQKEYQRHMDNQWDPLHNRPFDSRASGCESERRQGRESAWSIRDEIMAKYDALTSFAMAKKTADVLRANANPNLDAGHHPDTQKRKAGRKGKLIFIAE